MNMTFIISVLCGLFSAISYEMVKELIAQYNEMKELNKKIQFYNNQIAK